MRVRVERIMSTILILCMLLTLVPPAVFANTNFFYEDVIGLESRQLDDIIAEAFQTDV
ncbi:MAG: hypothetical protein GX066_07220 [Clostridiaceae bacterium]|nr:hypothetical protein [Clostridiaceae bacterium]